jgi:UDP-N-acetylglucosamine 4,6-dehydratase
MKKKNYFITGGTGSFGQQFAKDLVKTKLAKKIIIFSRDEYKQLQLQETDFVKKNKEIFRFYLGDIRDLSRLDWALQEEIDVVVHAAALKQVPATEYNPFETVKTNIIGTQNIVQVALKKNIDKTILISTDKAVSPINLYGSTKLTAEKLIISSNIFKGKRKNKFSVIRYGNVMGSRGSVIPILLLQNKNVKSSFTITDKRMTRFNISLKEASNFVRKCINIMKGSEIFIPKLPSYNILDLAKSINPQKKITYTGIRSGEKLHEELISVEDFNNSKVYKNFFIIHPLSKNERLGTKKLKSYNSLDNVHYLSIKELKKLIEKESKTFKI